MGQYQSSNSYIAGVPKGKEREIEAGKKKLLKEIMGANIPNLVKDMHLQIQESQ